MKEIILDFYGIDDISVLHEYLKEKLFLPRYYGKNLDALYEVLSEKSDIKNIIIYYSNCNLDDYIKKLINVFNACDINIEIRESDERN